MRKNYFLSLFLLMTAFWNVEAADGSKSTITTRNFETTVLPPTGGNPSGLSGVAVGGTGTRINLVWTDNSSDETLFEIAYTTQPSGYSFTTIAGGLGAIGATTLINLQPSTVYYIAVRALKAGSGNPVCSYSNPNTPTNGAPSGMTASCWSNLITVSTNANLPEPVTGATVKTPYTQRSNTLYFNDNSNNETNFLIERSTGGDFGTIAVLSSFPGTGQRSYVDNNTQPNTFYAYRVHAFNATGHALPESITGTFRTPNDPPSAPSGLATYAIGLNYISVYWINSSGTVLDFEVERSSDNVNWNRVDTQPANNTNSTLTGLNEDTKYFIRVKARNEGGYSGYSNVIQATTLKKVAPNPSANLSAKTVSTTQIDLTWNLGTQDNLTNNRVSQEIYRSSVSNNDGFTLIGTNGDEGGTYSDKTGSPKTKYWYIVRSVNYQGASAFSNTATATTLGPPFAPSNLATVLANDAIGNTIVKATWTDNSNDEWGFALERSIDSTFATGILKADLDSNNVTAISTPIEEGVSYFYRIKASNKYGDSKYSATSKLTTIVTVAPNAPYGLKGTATAAEVALKWGDDSNKEASFEIERSDDGKVFAKVGTTGRNEITYADKTVKEKTKYFYRVRATNVKGNSDYSNVVEITTLAKVSASIELATENIFQVYPNPTADAVKVTLSENNEAGVITITDRMNREVSRTILTANQSEYRLDLSNFSEGTYTISLRTATQQITKRVYKY